MGQTCNLKKSFEKTSKIQYQALGLFYKKKCVTSRNAFSISSGPKGPRHEYEEVFSNSHKKLNKKDLQFLASFQILHKIGNVLPCLDCYYNSFEISDVLRFSRWS